MLKIGLIVGSARPDRFADAPTQLSGPVVGGLLADWFGPSVIGWFATAIYGAGIIAAVADGFFGQRQPVTTTNLKEERYALCAP